MDDILHIETISELNAIMGQEEPKLTEIIRDIETELSLNMDRNSKTVIVSTLELLLNCCNHYYDRQFITRTESNKDIIADFEGLLQ